jgi:hypothetical protein
LGEVREVGVFGFLLFSMYPIPKMFQICSLGDLHNTSFYPTSFLLSFILVTYITSPKGGD